MFRRNGIVASGWGIQVVSVFAIAMMSLSSGCSRAVSPPGQSVFARPGHSPGQNEDPWNMAGQRPFNPSTTGAATPSQNPGNGLPAIPKMMSEKDRLEQQFAQSTKLVRAEPPRLIPIEPMEFPGTPEVVDSTSANVITTTGAGKMVVFSDPPATPTPTQKTAEQTKLENKNGTFEQARQVQNQKKTTQESESVVPAILIASPNTENKVALASGIESIEESKSSYHQPDRSESKIETAEFNPDAFAADRRAIPATEKQKNQSEKESSFSDSFGKIKVVTPANKPQMAESPSVSSESSFKDSVSSEAKAAEPPNSKSGPTLKTAPNVPVSQSTSAAPESATQATFGNDALLDAAGIKVDKNAFEFSPARKVPTEKPSKPENSNSTGLKTKEAEKSNVNSTSEFAVTPMKAVPDQVEKKIAEPKPIADPVTASSAGTASAEKLTSQFSACTDENKVAVCEKGKSVNVISTESLKKANWVTLPDATPASEKCEKACSNSNDAAMGSCDSNRTCEVEKSSAVPAPAKINTDFLPLNQPKSVSNISPQSELQKPELQKPSPSAFVPALAVPASFVVEDKLAELKIANPCFCTEIKGFGQVTRFPSNTFKGNQKALIYCEVENYSSKEEPGANGATSFVTRLKGRYEIFDSGKQSIQSGQFPDIEDITNRKRKDFYLYFPVAFKNLPSGDYELKVWIEEKDAPVGSLSRNATNSLRFSIGR